MNEQDLLRVVRPLTTLDSNLNLKELDQFKQLFEDAISHPAGTSLLSWPQQWGLPAHPSAEAIVKEALNWKPCVLAMKVIGVGRHPNRDDLFRVDVQVEGRIRTVVIGYERLRVGDICAVALSGVHLSSGRVVTHGFVDHCYTVGEVLGLTETPPGAELSISDFPEPKPLQTVTNGGPKKTELELQQTLTRLEKNVDERRSRPKKKQSPVDVKATLTKRSPEDIPRQYDDSQFVIFANLPSRELIASEIYDDVSGIKLEDGAKPWPYFRNAQTKEWWSLSVPVDHPIDKLVWMIDIRSLAIKEREDALAFLEEVLVELEERAARIGATIEPECPLADALARMDEATHVLSLRDYEVQIIVAAPGKKSYRVSVWWKALQDVGLAHGDGDLFWMYDDDGTELFCAEPFSVPGYFHPGNTQGSLSFPDVALHFRARDVADPNAILGQMADTAGQLARCLGAIVLTQDGVPFNLSSAARELSHVLEEYSGEEKGSGVNGMKLLLTPSKINSYS